MGVQPKLKHSKKPLRYGDCKSDSRWLHERYDFHSVRSSYTRGKSWTHAIFLRSLVSQKSSVSCHLRFSRVWSWPGYADEFSKHCAVITIARCPMNKWIIIWPCYSWTHESNSRSAFPTSLPTDIQILIILHLWATRGLTVDEACSIIIVVIVNDWFAICFRAVCSISR